MSRNLAFLILVCSLVGCTTRYSANPSGGPFARRPAASTDFPIPPAPAANNSPLVLGTPLPPFAGAMDENPIVPPRLPESIRLAGGDDLPAPPSPTKGFDYRDEGAAAFPPI